MYNYGNDLIAEALKNGQAINYRLVYKEKNWYLFVTTEKKAAAIITKRRLGAIGVDLNKAHVAWAEIDRHGNLIKFGKIPTPVQDRRNGQVTACLAEAVKQIVLYAKTVAKPVVIEKLDFSTKKTSFACSRNCCLLQKLPEEVDIVFTVKPIKIWNFVCL